jgi:hypothetical protein
MATRRFSRTELYSLRNDIPIDRVIRNALDIPCRISEGCFRFLCPLCNGFNTALNPATNLARCFYCEKNFNTIDLVMVITQSDFVNSIRFLKDYQQKNNPKQIQPIKPNAKARENGLEHIGNVLKTILPSKPITGPGGSGENVSDRLLALEQKLERLAQRIEEIAKSSS